MEESARQTLYSDLRCTPQCFPDDWRVFLFNATVLFSLVLTATITGVGIFSVAGPIVKSTGSVGLLLVYWMLGPLICLGWSN